MIPARAWAVFAIVFALMVADYVDRQVVVSMFPHLKAQWHLSDSQLGALVSVISVIVAIGTVPLSLLADRWSRVKSIFIMALVWSLATIAAAFASTYGELMAARSLVGLGEAAYGAVGAALLANLFPERMRSTILGAFLAAGLVGSVLGVVMGGVIAERWGWQAGFGVVGFPGIVLAFVFLLVVPECANAAREKGADSAATFSFTEVARALVRPRTALVTCLAAGLQLITVSTLYAWLPSYLNRYYGLAPDHAGIRTGIVVLLGGVGAVLWSAVADRLAARWPRARLYVPAVAGVFTTIFLCAAFGVMPAGTVQFALIVLGAMTMTASLGPAAAVVVDVVHPGLRATAAAILSLTQNLFGLAAGPILAGYLSDVYGLPVALAVVPLCCLLAAIVFVVAARSYVADLQRVHEVEGEPVALVPRPA